MNAFDRQYRLISEAYVPSNQIGIGTTNDPKWTWVWTVKMFIYHNTRQYKNFFQNWSREFQATWKANTEKITNSVGNNIPMNLAIAKDGETIYIYPNAFIDKIEDGRLHFHLDLKKYQEYKQYGYQVKTTNLQYWYNRNHNDGKAFDMLQKDYGVDTSVKDGIKMKDAGFCWYKVYGKEKGQLSDFYVRLNNVMILEDLTAAWDKLIALYDQAKVEKAEAAQKQKIRNTEINNRAREILANEQLKKQIGELYNQVFEKKSSEIASILDTFTVDQIKDIQALAYYRYNNHYKIYKVEHTTAEMADDYRWYSSQKAHLQGIRSKDYSILCGAKEALERKGE